MNSPLYRAKKWKALVATVLFVFLTTSVYAFAEDAVAKNARSSSYEKWKSIGNLAAETALDLLKTSDRPQSRPRTNIVVLANAGYAEINGESTQGCLDGLSEKTGASRGRNTLIEIHSAPWAPLWFAVFDKISGRCAYLEVDPSEAAKIEDGRTNVSSGLFAVRATEQIDAEHLYRHSDDFKAKCENKVFGGNEFRIVAICNAAAADAPTAAVRAFEFHDHYCPGVTSGILMAEYLKTRFPAGKGGYFVHSVDPWCKEDALLAILNATPGKRSYAVSYPSEEDRKRRIPEAQNASTIVYRQKEGGENWEGMVLGFEWAKTNCPVTGNVLVDKLCSDLWYLEKMEKPEEFVKAVKTFDLPEGATPADWARPGADPLAMLGMVR